MVSLITCCSLITDKKKVKKGNGDSLELARHNLHFLQAYYFANPISSFSFFLRSQEQISFVRVNHNRLCTKSRRCMHAYIHTLQGWADSTIVLPRRDVLRIFTWHTNFN